MKNEDRPLTLKQFVAALTVLLEQNPAFADSECMIAGEGGIAPASMNAVQFKDLPASKKAVRSVFDPAIQRYREEYEDLPPRKITLISSVMPNFEL